MGTGGYTCPQLPEFPARFPSDWELFAGPEGGIKANLKFSRPIEKVTSWLERSSWITCNGQGADPWMSLRPAFCSFECPGLYRSPQRGK